MAFRSMAVGVAIAAAVTVGAGPAAAQPAKKCASSYKLGKIAGVQKCLRHGQQCQVKHKSEYRKYGFLCVNARLKDR